MRMTNHVIILFYLPDTVDIAVVPDQSRLHFSDVMAGGRNATDQAF